METPVLNYVQIADNKITDNFGSKNFVALVYPKTDYAVERELLAELDTYDEVDYSMGLSNVEAMDGHMLAFTPPTPPSRRSTARSSGD